jgi:hypothetical protein
MTIAAEIAYREPCDLGGGGVGVRDEIAGSYAALPGLTTPKYSVFTAPSYPYQRRTNLLESGRDSLRDECRR